MAKHPQRVTKMEELAKLANVSVSTVSRALAGSPLINAKTRAKIEALAERHQYQVNEKARNLRLQRTNAISVVLMLDIKSGQPISDMFYLEMLGAIADELSARGYDLLLVHAPVVNVLELRNSRVFRQSDGMIFIGQGTEHKHLNQLVEHGMPIMVWGADLAKRRYSIVGSDNELGGYLATSHLCNLGRKRIAFLGDSELPEPQRRFDGYIRALRERKIKFDKRLQVHVPFEMAHAKEAIKDLLQRKVNFDGAFCCSDLIAISAISMLNEAGLRVPEDMAIVGYDDIELAAYCSPSLTTVRQSIAQGGRILVQKLIAQINGDQVSDLVLSTDLVVRRSSGAW